jgi:hypothetical protein
MGKSMIVMKANTSIGSCLHSLGICNIGKKVLLAGIVPATGVGAASLLAINTFAAMDDGMDDDDDCDEDGKGLALIGVMVRRVGDEEDGKGSLLIGVMIRRVSVVMLA